MPLYLSETSNNTIEVSKALADGISKTQIYEFIHDNNYEKIAPGLYISPDSFSDDLFVLHKRCPGGIISHDEALYYYGLVDREASFHTITVYSGYNASRLNDIGCKIYYVKKELLDLGKTTVISHFGNEIPMYDMERTIIDLLRNRSQFEIQDFNTALKSYVARTDKDLNKLSSYSKRFRMDKILRNYMEVLL